MSPKIKRLLNPRTNAPGWMAGAMAVVAVVTGLMHHNHVPLVTWVTAAGFLASLVVRTQTRPNRDPYRQPDAPQPR